MNNFKKLLPYLIFFSLIAVILYAVEAFKVNSLGNVGIGTTSEPTSKLEVEGRIKDATGYVSPVGSIIAYGGTTAPEGWLMCDGTSYLRGAEGSTYFELFGAIGSAYGSIDSNHFNVPDLRGRFLRGTDDPDGTGTAYSAANVDPDTAARTSLKVGGNIGNNIGSKQDDQFKLHTHDPVQALGPSGGGNNGYLTAGNGCCSSSSWTSHMQSRGGSETRPQNIYVNYIIKY